MSQWCLVPSTRYCIDGSEELVDATANERADNAANDLGVEHALGRCQD